MEQLQDTKEKVEVINASEDSVKVLLAKLKRIKAQKDEAVGGLVQNLMDTQEELRQKSAPFDQESEKIEAEIKALDACTNKLVADWISPHRKETMVESSVKIEVY